MGQSLKALFTLVVDAARTDPKFEHIRTSPGSEPARKMLDDVFQQFHDPDGNFLEQFQSTAFDARYFELYIFAYLSRSGYTVDRTHGGPVRVGSAKPKWQAGGTGT
jgi:hypothetical protein